MSRILKKRHTILLNAIITVLVVAGAKLAAHWLGWEVISLNPLFSGIVAANVFLMGFLLSGVLADYKESERLPGELAASIETIADEAAIVYESKKAEVAKQFLEYLLGLTVSVKNWFYKKEHTRILMSTLGEMSHHFANLEGLTQANFIARLKQEQSNIRRILIRIHTVRETSFIPSGYIIAHVTSLLLVAGLILVKIDPFYESLFFVSVITFLLRFLGLLIQDLDNPFGYPMLEHWMNKRPSSQLIEAWEHYIKDICRRLETHEVEELKHDVLSLARRVGQAAGGFLGIGNRLSAAEQVVLGRLEKAFS